MCGKTKRSKGTVPGGGGENHKLGEWHRHTRQKGKEERKKKYNWRSVNTWMTIASFEKKNVESEGWRVKLEEALDRSGSEEQGIAGGGGGNFVSIKGKFRTWR